MSKKKSTVRGSSFMMTTEVHQRLRLARLRKASLRNHRPCADCASTRVLCSLCARVWCPSCKMACPYHPATGPRTPTPRTRMTPVRAVSMPIKERRGTGTKPYVQPPIDIPKRLISFYEQIVATGWIVREITRHPEDRFYVEVWAPPGTYVTPPDTADWHGWRAVAWSTSIVKKGILIQATIRKA